MISEDQYAEIWNLPSFLVLSVFECFTWLLVTDQEEGSWRQKRNRTKRVWVLYQDSQLFIHFLLHLLVVVPWCTHSLKIDWKPIILWIQSCGSCYIYEYEYLDLESNERNQFINKCLLYSSVHNTNSFFGLCYRDWYC